jgi:hypothetical protein
MYGRQQPNPYPDTGMVDATKAVTHHLSATKEKFTFLIFVHANFKLK